MLNGDLEQVRIKIGKDYPKDAEVIVNGRKIDGCFHYRIEHGVGELPEVHLAVRPRFGLVFEAQKARLHVTTHCPACSFTHRQPTLPISETDYEELQKAHEDLQDRVLDGLEDPRLEEAAEYIKALLGDIRATLDAFAPSFLDDDDDTLTHAELQSAAVEDEVNKGRPDGNLAAGFAGVDSARKAHTRERAGATDEGREAVGDQANDGSSEPASGRDREGQGRDSGVGRGAPFDEQGYDRLKNSQPSKSLDDFGEGPED